MMIRVRVRAIKVRVGLRAIKVRMGVSEYRCYGLTTQ